MNPWLLCKGNFLLVNKGTLVLYFVDCYLTVTLSQRVSKISFAERKLFIVFRKKFLVNASEKKLSEFILGKLVFYFSFTNWLLVKANFILGKLFSVKSHWPQLDSMTMKSRQQFWVQVDKGGKFLKKLWESITKQFGIMNQIDNLNWPL